MLSTLVLMPPAKGDGTPTALGPLVRTLTALVPATMEGLVRDVIVLAYCGDEGVRRVAEHAGCALVEASRFEDALAQALAQARSAQLFVIRAGAAFDRGFIDEVATLLGPMEAERPGALLLRENPEGLLARLMPDRAPVAAVIASRAALESTAKDFAGLIRRLGRGRTVRSRASFAG